MITIWLPLSSVRRPVCYVLPLTSFSPTLAADKACTASCLQAKDEVKKLIEKAQTNELEAQPGRTMMESFENQVNQVLNKARDDAGKSAQNSLKDTNNVVRMVTAGSKGSFINISQVVTALCARATFQLGPSNT